MKSQGVVGGDGNEVARYQFEEDAEAELRRNEDEEEWSSARMLLSSPRATILTTPVSRRHL